MLRKATPQPYRRRMIISNLRRLNPRPAYIMILGISWHVHDMRSLFRVLSTYSILTVFNRHASRLLMNRLSYGQPQTLFNYTTLPHKSQAQVPFSTRTL